MLSVVKKAILLNLKVQNENVPQPKNFKNKKTAPKSRAA